MLSRLRRSAAIHDFPGREPLDSLAMPSDFDRLVAALRRAKRVSVLTGAGMSAESGIATFRGAGGLWEGHRVEEVATPEAFSADPLKVWKFYEERRRAVKAAAPNHGHEALVALEKRIPVFHVATQNVDGLHRRAGSRNLVELHGCVERRYCVVCRRTEEDLEPIDVLPPLCAACGGMMRPDIVWFGEPLSVEGWEDARQAAREAEVYLVVGTSSQVYPAAGLALVAADAGADVFEINPEETSLSPMFAGAIREPSGAALPRVLAALDE
jgi:NAD-dependent deacetylase